MICHILILYVNDFYKFRDKMEILFRLSCHDVCYSDIIVASMLDIDAITNVM